MRAQTRCRLPPSKIGPPIGLMVLLISIQAAPCVAETANIKIRVRAEITGNGVPSKIILLKGESEKIPVDYTDAQGTLSLSHDCALGERFLAEPKDSSFFQSDEAGCKKDLTLLVVERDTPEGVLVRRRTKTINAHFSDGSKATYLIAWNGRIKTRFFFEQNPGFTEARFETMLTRLTATGGLSEQGTERNLTINQKNLCPLCFQGIRTKADIYDEVINLEPSTFSDPDNSLSSILKKLLPEEATDLVGIEIEQESRELTYPITQRP